MSQKPTTSAANVPPVGGPPQASRPAGDANPGAPVASIAITRSDMLDVQKLDPATIDPDRHYRWTALGKVESRKRLGYIVEMKREGGPRTLIESDATADGTIRFGDTVLMSCPRDHRQAREREVQTFNERRLRSTVDQANERAAKIGVKLQVTSQEVES